MTHAGYFIRFAIIAASILLWPIQTKAHEVPDEVTVLTFLKPEGKTLTLLVRAPMKSLRDGDCREVGGVALMEYDGPGVSATGDQEWGGYCAWWKPGSRGRWVALTCWRLTAPATLTTSRILACACRMASSS